VFLARLYWFTVEFGLLNSSSGLRIYGGGILSSPGETDFAMTAAECERRPFALVDVMRTPYRIDIMQPIYYILDSLDELFNITEAEVMVAIKQAKSLGMFEPTFPKKQKQAC